MFSSFLIKYAEIGVKGKNRYLFEDALVRQIKYALMGSESTYRISKTPGRIFLDFEGDFDYDDTIDRLQHVFGVSGICPMVRLDMKQPEELYKDIIKYFDETYPDKKKTFKVCARRANKGYCMDSMELDREIGGQLLDAFPELSVDVHHPEIELVVEVRDRIFVYSEIIPGPGGMPIGTNGKAMLLLSGGIDSPVAGYMIAKRGVKIDAVYFHAPPYTSERAKQKVVDLAKYVSKYSGPINLHIINFTDIQLYIYEKCPHEELTIIMRRYMMKIAEEIAKENECQGLITGESIGQVASQTTHSLLVTNEVCTLPVFRPLIGFDKEDIVTISKKIDTYETSILPFEDCCTIFVAKHPVTKPNLAYIKRHEENLSEKIDELVKTALDTREIVTVSGREE